MMILRVPVVNGSVVSAERDFQFVALVEPDDAALHFDVEAGRGGRPHPGVRARREAQLAEVAPPGAQRRAEMQNELPFVKAALRAVLIGGREIEIAEARQS